MATAAIQRIEVIEVTSFCRPSRNSTISSSSSAVHCWLADSASVPAAAAMLLTQMVRISNKRNRCALCKREEAAANSYGGKQRRKVAVGGRGSVGKRSTAEKQRELEGRARVGGQSESWRAERGEEAAVSSSGREGGEYSLAASSAARNSPESSCCSWPSSISGIVPIHVSGPSLAPPMYCPLTHTLGREEQVVRSCSCLRVEGLCRQHAQ